MKIKLVYLLAITLSISQSKSLLWEIENVSINGGRDYITIEPGSDINITFTNYLEETYFSNNQIIISDNDAPLECFEISNKKENLNVKFNLQARSDTREIEASLYSENDCASAMNNLSQKIDSKLIGHVIVVKSPYLSKARITESLMSYDSAPAYTPYNQNSSRQYMSSNMNFAVGGANDINSFRENINNNYLPLPSDVTYEGLFYDYCV